MDNAGSAQPVTPRGPYAKGRAKREEILDAALTIIGERGYSRATVRELADSVGLSTTALLHYFGSKDALLTEALRRRDVSQAATMLALLPELDGLSARVVSAVREATLAPGYIQLMARLAAAGTEPDHVAHEFFRERYSTVRDVTADIVRASRPTDATPADETDDQLEPEEIGVLVFVLMDGLFLQWLYDPSIDMARLMKRFLAALGLPQSGEGGQDDT